MISEPRILRSHVPTLVILSAMTVNFEATKIPSAMQLVNVACRLLSSQLLFLTVALATTNLTGQPADSLCSRMEVDCTWQFEVSKSTVMYWKAQAFYLTLKFPGICPTQALRTRN